MPVNVENASYQSCVGRIPSGKVHDATVDGLYTSGSQAGSAQLVYVPMKNAFSKHGSPSVTKFVLPQGGAASAIATARVGANGDATSDLYLTTDLYAASGSSIYLFAAADQVASTVEKCVSVVNSSLVSGTTKLLCQASVDTVTLRGLTEGHLVYYVSCPLGQVSESSAWSAVNVVLTDVEHISAYVNRIDGGNTIFSAGGGSLRQMVQATSTKSKLWRTHEITLATQPEQPSLPINSYTTTVQALDSIGAPARNSRLLVSAKSRTPVYINGLYTVLNATPEIMYTDSAGLITVIERVEDIHGSVLTFSTEDGLTSTVINPFDVSFSKLTELDTPDKLTKAEMPIKLKAGGFLGQPEYRTFLTGSPDKLEAIATNLGSARKAYADIKDPNHATVGPQSTQVSMSFFDDFANAVEVTAGDFVQSIKTTWSDDIVPAFKAIGDEISNAWHTFVQIGDEIIHTVMHAIEDVVAVVKEILKKITEKAQDLLDYLKVLFNWNDITRTKDVISKIAKAWIEDKVQDIRNFKTYLDNGITGVEKDIERLTHITDWSIPDDTMLTSAPSAGLANLHQGQTSASSLLAHHYRNHVKISTLQSDSAFSGVADDPALQGLITILSDTVDKEVAVIGAALTKIKDLCKNFAAMPVQDFFTEVLGILAVAGLKSFQNVIDALLDILVLLAESIIQELDRKIHIPVLSDVLNDLGIPDFSLLDIICYILAAFFTIPYKAVTKNAPFPDNDDTRRIINASGWTELAALFGQDSQIQNANVDISTMDTPSQESNKMAIDLNKQTQDALNFIGHEVVAVTEWLGDVFGGVIASKEPGTAGTLETVLSGALGCVSGVLGAAVDALVPKCPLQNPWAKMVGYCLVATRISFKIICSDPGQKILKKTNFDELQLSSAGAAQTSAVVDVIISFLSLIPTGFHFDELNKIGQKKERSAAIIEEVTNITWLAQRVAFAVAVWDVDPDTRSVAVIVYGVASTIAGGLQFSISLLK